MLKAVGILLLMAVCSSIGFLKANKLCVRQKKLYGICLFTDEAKERIRVGEEMEKIINSVGDRAGLHKEGISIKIDGEGFNSGDVLLINEFLSGLGMGDTTSQLKRCENYSGLFERLLREAENDAKSKATVYRKLGIFAALLIGVVLI